MRVMSLRDLRLIPELSVYNEIELISPAMDELVKKFLGQLGYDLDYEVQYVPSKHRDLSGKVAVGFQVIGDISVNRNFINSPMCSITERMVAAAYQDPSLTREMANMMGANPNTYQEHDDAEEYGNEDGDYIEEDYEWVVQQIKQLQDVHDMVRGVEK